MATHPISGDILLRGDIGIGFEAVDAVTRTPLHAPFATFEEALAFAFESGAQAVWQQTTDNRGRPMGDAFSVAHHLCHRDEPARDTKR